MTERTSTFGKVAAILDIFVKLAAVGALYGILVILHLLLNEWRRMNGNNFHWDVHVQDTVNVRAVT